MHTHGVKAWNINRTRETWSFVCSRGSGVVMTRFRLVISRCMCVANTKRADCANRSLSIVMKTRDIQPQVGCHSLLLLIGAALTNRGQQIYIHVENKAPIFVFYLGGKTVTGNLPFFYLHLALCIDARNHLRLFCFIHNPAYFWVLSASFHGNWWNPPEKRFWPQKDHIFAPFRNYVKIGEKTWNMIEISPTLSGQ